MKRALLDPAAAAPASPTAWASSGPSAASWLPRLRPGRIRRVQPDTSTQDTWTEPGTFEIMPGVYRIPLPLPNDGLRAVNVYALMHGGDLVLIDSGWAITGARALLDEGLDKLGLLRRGRPPDPGHARAPGPLHPGRLPAARVRHHGQPGHQATGNRWPVP